MLRLDPLLSPQLNIGWNKIKFSRISLSSDWAVTYPVEGKGFFSLECCRTLLNAEWKSHNLSSTFELSVLFYFPWNVNNFRVIWRYCTMRYSCLRPNNRICFPQSRTAVCQAPACPSLCIGGYILLFPYCLEYSMRGVDFKCLYSMQRDAMLASWMCIDRRDVTYPTYVYQYTL